MVGPGPITPPQNTGIQCQGDDIPATRVTREVPRAKSPPPPTCSALVSDQAGVETTCYTPGLAGRGKAARGGVQQDVSSLRQAAGQVGIRHGHVYHPPGTEYLGTCRYDDAAK